MSICELVGGPGDGVLILEDSNGKRRALEVLTQDGVGSEDLGHPLVNWGETDERRTWIPLHQAKGTRP